MFEKRVARFALPVTIALGLLSAGTASAEVFLQVNTTTGDLRIYGAADDLLSRYEIKTAASAEKSFNYTLFQTTAFGETSVAAGFGVWHPMGTSSGVQNAALGYKVTNQIGEMSAIFAYGTGADTSKILTFSSLAADSTGHFLDLGNILVPGSAKDLTFTYVNTMGYSYGLGSGPKTYTLNVAGSPYNGSYTGVTPITSDASVYPLDLATTRVSYISAVPEPSSLAMMGAGAVLLWFKRRKGGAKA